MAHSWFRRPRGRLAVALLLLLPAGCGRAEERPVAGAAVRSVKDDAGRTVTLPSPARRVLSLVPAQTEILVRLAGPAVLVGRTAWDLDPALARLPRTENALSPSVEWVASLGPDLVVAWPDRDSRTVIARLEALGVPVYAAGTQSLAGIDSAIARFGVLLGREATADSLRAGISRELAAVRAAVAGRPRPRVLYAVSIDPPIPATGATWLGELVELAGGANIFAALDALWPQVSLEEVVRRRPQVIIRPVERPGEDALAQLRGRPGWRGLEAVREGRVHPVDVNLLNRPSASVGAAARALAAAIHPEVFGGGR